MHGFVLLRRVLLFSVFCFAFGAQSFAAENVYMTIVGPQGAIKGEAKSPHGSEWIPVTQFSMSLEAPRDVATGQASGKRQHEPLKVLKKMDAASPKLERAASSGERLKEVVFQVYRTGPGGREELYETIRLMNPMISSIHATGGATAKSGQAPQEELTFTYEKIEYTYTQQNPARTVQAPTSVKAERR